MSELILPKSPEKSIAKKTPRPETARPEFDLEAILEKEGFNDQEIATALSGLETAAKAKQNPDEAIGILKQTFIKKHGRSLTLGEIQNFKKWLASRSGLASQSELASTGMLEQNK